MEEARGGTSHFDLTSDFLSQPHFHMQHVTADTITSRTWTRPSQVLHRLLRSINPSKPIVTTVACLCITASAYATLSDLWALRDSTFLAPVYTPANPWHSTPFVPALEKSVCRRFSARTWRVTMARREAIPSALSTTCRFTFVDPRCRRIWTGRLSCSRSPKKAYRASAPSVNDPR
jgi:hypothetical protein